MQLSETPVIVMHIKPKPVGTRIHAVPARDTGLQELLPASCATELPELGAAPPRRSFTQLEFGV